MESRTVTAVLEAPAGAVFDYLSRVENLPDWASEFARELRFEDGHAVVVNGLGEFRFEIAADPGAGVIDMYAGPDADRMAVFPTRVVPLGERRCAYTFTMFRWPDMPADLFDGQHESLRRELENVRRRFGGAREADG